MQRRRRRRHLRWFGTRWGVGGGGGWWCGWGGWGGVCVWYVCVCVFVWCVCVCVSMSVWPPVCLSRRRAIKWKWWELQRKSAIQPSTSNPTPQGKQPLLGRNLLVMRKTVTICDCSSLMRRHDVIFNQWNRSGWSSCSLMNPVPTLAPFKHSWWTVLKLNGR